MWFSFSVVFLFVCPSQFFHTVDLKIMFLYNRYIQCLVIWSSSITFQVHTKGRYFWHSPFLLFHQTLWCWWKYQCTEVYWSYYLWPVVVFYSGNYVFQNNNTPVNRARSFHAYKRENYISSMLLPAQSPDPNISKLLLLWKSSHRKWITFIKNTLDLDEIIRLTWTIVPLIYVRSLHQTLQRRIPRIFREKGHITKYRGKNYFTGTCFNKKPYF